MKKASTAKTTTVAELKEKATTQDLHRQIAEARKEELSECEKIISDALAKYNAVIKVTQVIEEGSGIRFIKQVVSK